MLVKGINAGGCGETPNTPGRTRVLPFFAGKFAKENENEREFAFTLALTPTLSPTGTMQLDFLGAQSR